MATLDIRDIDDGIIDKIKWGDDDLVINNQCQKTVSIKDCQRGGVLVKYDEIDDLIKALQKAKELWLDKT